PLMLSAVVFALGQRPDAEPKSRAAALTPRHAGQNGPKPQPKPPDPRPGPGPEGRPRVHNAKAARLIDRLAQVTDEGVGYHSRAPPSAFLAVDEGPEFRGGVIGSKRPVASEGMRDLVRLGPEALPDLIGRLSDPRKTQVTVGATALWHSDEYDPRYLDPRR